MTINRLRLLALGLAVHATLLVACGSAGGSSNNDDGVTIEPITGLPTEAPAVISPVIETPGAPTVAVPGSQTPAAPTQVPPANGSAELHGFVYPIAGGCLPSGDQLMPNAPRTYRNGTHEGVDFYDVDNCASISAGTPVQAAKAGRVIRADLAYTDLTAAELEKHNANLQTDEALDAFRGRQVWVDHGGGIVTRYAHLSGIAPGITAGSQVAQGQTIAFVGESGTPESIFSPGHEYHLHFEVRVGSSFLGKDLPPAEVRALYKALFAP